MLSEKENTAICAKNVVFNGYLTMHYPDWFKPESVDFSDGEFENSRRCTKLTQDGRVILVETLEHTLGHLSVIVDMGDHYILIAGDASYDGTLHRQSTAKMRELCRRKPTITQFAHDMESKN